MTVSWTPPKRKDWKGKINSYRMTLIRNNPQSQSSSDTVSILPKANNPDPSLATEPLQLETYFLENLEENYQYTVLISVVNSAGSGVASDPLLQIMPQAG